MLALLSAGFAAEPRGYWQGAIHGPTPATIAGGAVIHTPALAGLLARGHAVLVDVSEAPVRPVNEPPGAVWLPLPHDDIPGSAWIPDAGRAEISPALDRLVRRRLAALTGGDRGVPVVVYCHPNCWMSWNAAKRIISDGYGDVLWYPDGIEGWVKAGHATAAARPERP